MTLTTKNIYLLKYKTNQSDDMKFKAFDSVELATQYHLNFKENVAKIGYSNREIIHYELLVIPFNLDLDTLSNK